MPVGYKPAKSTLQSARGKATSNGASPATITFTVPSGGRYVEYGEGWFDNHHADDYVKISILAPDDSLVGTYYDSSLPANNQGFYFNKNGYAKFSKIGSDPGKLPEGFKVKVEAYKGDQSNDTFRCNMKWGTIG